MPRYETHLLQPNSMFITPILSSDKLMLLPAKRLLTSDDIATLKRWQIEAVEVAGRRLTEAEAAQVLQAAAAQHVLTRAAYGKVNDYEKKRCFGFYIDTEVSIRSLAETIVTGLRVEPEKIKGMVRRLVEEIRRSRDVYLSIIHNDYGKGEHLYFHILNNMILCLTIGVSMNLKQDELINLGLGAFFADVGMLKVPKHVRDKTRELTDADLNLIRKHPLEGEKILNKWITDYEDSVIRMTVEHHENVDGSGYPYGKSSHEIHDHAKILALADVYNAMTKKRAYREGKAGVSVMKDLILMKDKKFDAVSLKTFLGVMSVFPVGTFVKLSNGSYALVVKPSAGDPLRPSVKVMFSETYARLEQPVLIDLRGEGSTPDAVKIVGPVDASVLPKVDVVEEL
ncbi:hypothetical protein HY522_02665 [bacterium]|nr:hypothetical protein [bacterium]